MRSLLSARTSLGSSWLDPRVISLQKRKGVFTASSPVCCFPAKIGRFEKCGQVCVQINQVDEQGTALAEVLEKRCSNSNETPFHRHIVLNEGFPKMATTYAQELVNKVFRGLRQQMLELQFAGPSPSEPVFDLKDESATWWVDEFDDFKGAQLPGNLVHAGKIEEICWVKEFGLHKKISGPEAKAQRHRSCTHQVGCDRQRRRKQIKSKMPTCGERVAREDKREPCLCMNYSKCNAPMGNLKCCWDCLSAIMFRAQKVKTLMAILRH